MKQWKKLLGIFMSCAVLITGGVLPQKNAAVAEGAADYGISNPRIENGVTTWDKIKFGSYYKDAEVEPEPIKWRVLSVDGDDAFLIADQILDAKLYNEEYEDVTWETCTLRKWLNNDFYNEAFDDEEKKAVKETTVVNEDNPFYDTDGGNNTTDKVYLLSIAEASNAAYGFDTKVRKKSETRKAKNTDYAKVNNVWSSTYDGTEGFGCWWLRSPGGECNGAACVSGSGNGSSLGYYVNKSNYGVRPALHINLSSSLWSKAGEVTAARSSDDKPTASPEPTKEPASTDNPAAPTEPTQTPTATAQPIPPTVTTQNPAPTSQPVLKQLKLSAVKYIMNTKKITGKVSVSRHQLK